MSDQISRNRKPNQTKQTNKQTKKMSAFVGRTELENIREGGLTPWEGIRK